MQRNARVSRSKAARIVSSLLQSYASAYCLPLKCDAYLFSIDKILSNRLLTGTKVHDNCALEFGHEGKNRNDSQLVAIRFRPCNPAALCDNFNANEDFVSPRKCVSANVSTYP